MSAPMLLDGERAVGGLFCTGPVDPFDEREEALLEGFAAQAAVVVRNVHLVRALDDRSAELARRVQQMEALSEVGQTVGSSLVLDEVSSDILKNAVRFAGGCDGGSMMEYLEGERSFSVRSAYPSSPELLARPSEHTHRAGDDTGRPCRLGGHAVSIPDLSVVDLDPHMQLLYDDGWRSVMAVPVLRGERIIGALVVVASHLESLRGDGGIPTDIRQPVGDGGRQRAAIPRAREEERRTGSDEPAQVRLLGQHVA